MYNYRELRAALEADGCRDFTTGSDSEVVMLLIERTYQGDLLETMRRILPKLDGVYALVVTDHKSTVLARDRIGVRQLYFRTAAVGVTFASEKKALMTDEAPDGHPPFFETKGRACRARLTLPGQIRRVTVADLMEKPDTGRGPLRMKQNVLEMAVRPFEIVTLELSR